MRKKWLSRALAAVLIGVLAVGLLAGCGAEEKKEESKAHAASSSAPAAESSAPAEEEYVVSYPMDTDVELRVYIGGGQPLSSTQTDYANVPFWAGFEERTGIKCTWEYPVAGSDATAAYNLMLTEEDLPHIVIGYSAIAQQTEWLNGAYLTNACDTEEELKAAMAWVNWAYTEEGNLYWNFGIEGESYEIVDGAPQFTEKVTKDERGMTQALRDWTGASAQPVGIQMEQFVRAKNNPACGDSVDKWVSNQDGGKYYLPGLPLTADEQSAKSDIDTAIGTYVQENSIKFITGEKSFDEWDAYVADIDKMGLQESLKIANDGYARFMGK